MNVGLLVAIIVVGTLVFVGTLLLLIFSAVRRSIARQLVALASEGIVLDSGSVHMKLRFRNFRGPRVAIGVGVRAGPGRMVLTQQRLTFVPMGQNRYGFASLDREMLGRFSVGVDEGRLHMHSDDPPNASGTVDLFLSVANPARWVDALTTAGARPRGT